MDQITYFLGKYGLTIVIAALPIILVLILIIYIISMITKKPFDFKLGPFALKLSGGKKSDNSIDYKKIENYLTFFKENNTNHADLIDDAMYIAMDKTEKIDLIKFKESMTKQMILCEEANVKIKSILMDKFYNLIKTKNPNFGNIKNTKDYRYYQVIVSFILEDIKRNTIKESVNMSEMIEYSEIEYNSFVTQKTDVILTILLDYIDFMYNSDTISNDEIRKQNEQIEPKIKEQYSVLYDKIKTIIIDDSETIKKIKIAMEDSRKELKKKLLDGCVVNTLNNMINPEKNS